jgi:hypothetical protein
VFPAGGVDTCLPTVGPSSAVILCYGMYRVSLLLSTDIPFLHSISPEREALGSRRLGRNPDRVLVALQWLGSCGRHRNIRSTGLHFRLSQMTHLATVALS